MVEQAAQTNGDNALNREELLQLAIQSAKANNRAGARVMFNQVLNDDPRNERALLWLAFLAQNETEKRRYLTMTLRVNPDNDRARRELDRITHQQEAHANKTLLYGGIFVGGLVLVSVVVVILLVLVASMG